MPKVIEDVGKKLGTPDEGGLFNSWFRDFRTKNKNIVLQC
ncbi:hypothetical protein BH11BAC1_BH11BAC1_00740 [soil metagenome]